MIDYAKILLKKYPDTQWTLRGDDYSGLEWNDNTNKPTKKELDGLWDEVQAEFENEKFEKLTKKNALLEKLGITAEEADLLAKSLKD